MPQVEDETVRLRPESGAEKTERIGDEQQGSQCRETTLKADSRFLIDDKDAEEGSRTEPHYCLNFLALVKGKVTDTRRSPIFAISKCQVLGHTPTCICLSLYASYQS